MNKFKAEFYETKGGEIPVKDFLDGLDAKMRAKIAMKIGLLEEYGNELREPHSKPLSDGIFELRVRVRTDHSRILYFFFHGGRIILTNGFTKKTQKTPSAEIQKAKLYKEDFMERMEKYEV